MTQEQKVQAYDEVREKIALRFGSNVAEEIFSEFEMSEDEKIRNFISNELACLRATDGKGSDRYEELTEAIAWLEKQDNKSVNIDIESMVSLYEQRVLSQSNGVRNNPLVNMCLTAFRRGIENTLEELNLKKLEKKYEKNTNPKTMIVKFICKKDWHGIGDYYYGKIYNGYPCEKEQKGYDIYDDNHIPTFCDEDFINEYFNIVTEENKGEQKPAEKVEPKFHKGDWVVVSTTKGDRVVQIASVEYFKDCHPSYLTTEGRWFDNRTKARLLTNKDVEITTIPESRAIVNKIKSWSEEDETNSYHLKTLLENLAKDNKYEFRIISDNDRDKYTAWLKSLKQRIGWKPSEEQMKALDSVIDEYDGYPEFDSLVSLKNDLKKL